MCSLTNANRGGDYDDLPHPAPMAQLLITGGAGFIGSHLVQRLIDANEVVVYDNLCAGHREAVRYGTLVEGDITDLSGVRRALREHDIWGVMHFAAFLDVGESVREPAKYYRNNVSGALTVLEAMALKHGLSQSTAHRRLTSLRKKGLLALKQHDKDARVRFVMQTERTERYLAHMGRCVIEAGKATG